MSKHGGSWLWRIGLGMALAAVVGFGAAWLGTGNRTPLFRARALVNLAHLPSGSFQNQEGNVTNLGQLIMHVHSVAPEVRDELGAPDFQLLLTSDEMAAKVRDCVVELRGKLGVAGPPPSVERVRGAMEVRAKEILQTIYTVEYQQVIELFFSADDPDVAAGAVNAWAELAVGMAREAAERVAVAGKERFETQLMEARSQRDGILEEVGKLDSELSEDAGEERLEAFETALSEARVRAASLAVDLAKAKAVAAASGTPENSAVEVAGLVAEVNANEAEMGRLAEETKGLRERVAAMGVQRRKLDTDAAVQERRIEDLSLALEELGMRPVGNMPELAIASRALPPTSPVAVNRMKVALVAAVLAAVFVPFVWFGMCLVRLYGDRLVAECRG